LLGSVTAGAGILISSDAGTTWTVAEPSPDGAYGNLDQVVASSDGSHIYAAGEGLAISKDSGATWTTIQAAPWTRMATSADGTLLVASVETGLQVSLSTDSGQSWTQLVSAGQNFSYFAVASDDQKVIGAAYLAPLYALSAVTTAASTGFVAGNQYQSATLQYYGDGLFSLIDNEGLLTVQ
jgi:hypothetical protein